MDVRGQRLVVSSLVRVLLGSGLDGSGQDSYQWGFGGSAPKG